MKRDVGAYYNQTQNHYQRWWHLDQGMALHYGIWYANTRNFLEALHNTNVHLAKLARVKEGSKVLDAGCGVGGSTIFLAKIFKAKVTGISLSDLQIATAKKNARKNKVEHSTKFAILDFTQTGYANDCFDLIWACESSSSVENKQAMANEWFRLLKPGGKLVLADFFKTVESTAKEETLLNKWSALWAMSPLVTADYLCQCLTAAGFEISKRQDLTANIKKTVKRMYLSYWLGLVPSVLYNTFLGARPYARNHYKSGLYQHKSLQKKMWQYETILAIKPQ